MNCDIYKLINIKGAYLFVKEDTDLETDISKDTLSKIGDLEYFKSINFDEDSPLIAVNQKEVIQNIEINGFHIQIAKIKKEEVSDAGAVIGGGILAASLGLGLFGALVGAAAGYIIANLTKEGNKNDS
ncbi:MAG: YcgL domain-containing protein [Campylobacteraceae bacterium]|nr:YcgL domain-containing protein [Campylobacteraceae bacterium]